MTTRTIGVFIAATLCAGAAGITSQLASAHDFSGPSTLGRPASGSVQVYLHRDGGRVRAGKDDSRTLTSDVVRQRGLDQVDLPGFSGSDRQWNALVQCVQGHFAPFGVDVTDERPAGDAILAMVGGRPSALGLPEQVGGMAPYGGRVLPNAVVFVFQLGQQSQRSLCETTAHEIGHALGLDHTQQCNDLMSYGACGPKTFRDEAVRCGEWESRTCSNGAASQNSFRLLAAMTGLRRAEELEPVREPATRVASRAPSSAPGGSTRGRTPSPEDVVVQVRARDPHGIRHVDLIWQDDRARRLRCGEINPQQPFTCTRQGSLYTFRVRGGADEARFAARITNGRGDVRPGPVREIGG